MQYLKYLNYNVRWFLKKGILNESGLKILCENYIHNIYIKKSTNLKEITENYFQNLRKTSKSLMCIKYNKKAFSKFIYLKYFEIDDRSILKLVKKILIIYKNKSRKMLLRTLIRWNHQLYLKSKL